MQQIQSTYCKWIESAAHPGPLLRFWKMDPSLLGALRAGVVTVRQFDISSRVCKWIESAAHPGPLLRFWKMDPSLLGALRAGVVTVRQFDISSRVCSRFNPLTVSGLNLLHTQGLCCDSGRWIRPYLGSCNTMVVTVRYKMSSGVFSPGGN